MPRPIEFDRESVLENAMLLFWQKGYKVTSMRDLVTVTGLKPGSLYGTFKSKRLLFLTALERYFERMIAEFRAILHAKEHPVHRIHHFFDFIIAESVADNTVKGCLLVNTVLEVPTDDKEINKRVAQMFAEVEAEFRQLLIDAQQSGEISSEKDPEALAKLILATLHGLRVISRTRPGKEALYKIVQSLMLAIENQPST